MAQEEPPVSGESAPVKTKESVEKRLRDGPIRRTPGVLADSLFNDPGFQMVMNRWMIRTHILWGVSLAFTFIGLNYTLIWLNPPPWSVVVTFLPLGLGYLAWQFRKFNPPKPPETN